MTTKKVKVKRAETHRSVTPGLLRCGFASGDISVGCSSTKVGCTRVASPRASNNSFSTCPVLGALRTLGSVL